MGFVVGDKLRELRAIVRNAEKRGGLVAGSYEKTDPGHHTDAAKDVGERMPDICRG